MAPERATPQQPLISVITVCFNAAKLLPRTMASLAAQTWASREWVVVDGGSTDGTQALVHSPALAPAPAAFVSVRDRGIYDAMNKGVSLSKGEWLYFLNADDRFFDAQVLADLAAFCASRPAAAFVIGGVVVETPAQSYLHPHRHINRWSLPFCDPCHQGVLVRRELFDQIGLFDLRWPTSADYEWFLRASQAGHRLHHIDRTLAYFPDGGAHAADPTALALERQQIRLSYLSPPLLAAGNLTVRALHRLSKTFRGGLALGQARSEAR